MPALWTSSTLSRCQLCLPSQAMAVLDGTQQGAPTDIPLLPSEPNTGPTSPATQRYAQLTLLLLALKALKSREELIADQESIASQSVYRSDQLEDCKIS